MSKIFNQQPGPRPIPDGELQVDITRPNRQMNEAVLKDQEARRAQEAEKRSTKAARESNADRIEVSPEARLMLARSENAKLDAAETKKQHVAEMHERYLEGTLVTKERIEKAADAILGA